MCTSKSLHCKETKLSPGINIDHGNYVDLIGYTWLEEFDWLCLPACKLQAEGRGVTRFKKAKDTDTEDVLFQQQFSFVYASSSSSNNCWGR